MENLSIYDILGLREAEGDEASSNNTDAKNDGASDDDFSIDTTLDGDDGSDEDSGNADGASDGGDDINDSDTADDSGEESSDNGGSTESGEEPNEANTDIFFSLSKEEQQEKIKMLKRQYSGLYSSCDDLIERINDLNTDESNIEPVSRLASTMYDLKTFLSDYLIHVFPQKSFIENDIMFNRFLDVINTIALSFDKLYKKIENDNDSNK